MKKCTPEILFVLVVIVCHAALTTAKATTVVKAKQVPDPKPLTLDEYFKGLYTPEEFEGRWVNDNLLEVRTEQDVYLYDVTTGTNETKLRFKEISESMDIGDTAVIISEDLKFALIRIETSRIWEETPCAKFSIYDFQERTNTEIPVCIQFVEWTLIGNGMAIVSNNNLFYRSNAHKSTKLRQITFDGNKTTGIYNGITSWYVRGDEEPVEALTAVWISPNNSYLTFLRYNDSQIPELQWPVYGEPGQNGTEYPEYRKVRYPMAGHEGSKVDVFVVSLTDEKSKLQKMKFVSTDCANLYMFGDAVWNTNDTFLIPSFNRVQNTAIMHLCTAKTATCKPVYNYTLAQGWIDDLDPEVPENGALFAVRRPLKAKNSTLSYFQVVMVNLNGTEQILTEGETSVTALMGWDDTENVVYFMGSSWNGEPANEVHLYSVSVNGSKIQRCITCNLTNSEGHLCRSNSISFSHNFTHFIHTCNGPKIPETTTRVTKTGAIVKYPGPTEVKNSELKTLMAKRDNVPTEKTYLVPLKIGFGARARLYLPANLDKRKKYPLLVSVYAGPGSQSVKQEYETYWEKTVVSRKNVIVAQIDGRGSSASSTNMMFALHRKFGTVEIEDQIAVTKWLIKNVPFIDPKQISIFGWSYGGFAAAKVLQTDKENIFKCGISVAPVTNWMHYLAPYTECYMGLPTQEDNLKGYQNADLTCKDSVEMMRNKTFLLIHGTADTTVGYQNSMMLSRALQESEILFDQMTYPDEDHSINGHGEKHIRLTMEKFLFTKCFK